MSNRTSRRARALPPLLPAPRKITPRDGRFQIDSSHSIVVDPLRDARDFNSAQVLATEIERRCGVRVPIEARSANRETSARGSILLERSQRGADDSASDERYEIDVDSDRVRLRAAGAAGLRWAVATLVQAIDARGRVPSCRIEDAPDFPRRGIMLDVSRGKVPSADCLRELVDRCAALKLNVLMLYVEHTFAFHRHPKIGEGSSPLDAETLVELDRYAASHCVELVPCLQSLGHMERILSLPEYEKLAETDLGWTLSPAEKGSYRLLEDLYGEFLPCFQSSLFNANCDEPWDLEKGKSAARAAELAPGGVFQEHLHRVQTLAEAHGKRTMAWADVVHAHPERIPEIDRGIVMLDWWYEAEHIDFERVRVFAENGLDFWVCPGTSSWNCLFPRVENSLQNIERWTAAGRSHGASGVLNTDWGDFGHYNLLGNSWLAYAWGAQQSWSGACDAADFDRAFSRGLFGDASGRVARLYRQLGAIHDAGFQIFNGSAIQYLFFDDVERAYFTRAARGPALRRSRIRVEKIRAELADSEDLFGGDTQTWRELCYAADASLFAIEKAEAALEFIAWRRDPGSRKARERASLAKRLEALAARQRDLARELRRLWLARSEPSELRRTLRRISGSTRSLTRAARRLRRNQPGKAPEPHVGFSGAEMLREVRRALGPR